MINVLLFGCGGAMGKAVAAAMEGKQDCRIMGGVDIAPADVPFPVFTDPRSCNADFDVIIDFSHPKALSQVAATAKASKKGVVLATTGYTQAQLEEIDDLAQEVPVFFSANMSMGVALMQELCIRAAQVLGINYDIEIVEKHHNRKVDAPSGTAFMLANTIASALPGQPRYVYDRHSLRARREKDEIGIHSVRGGTIPGEHDVIFAGPHEVLTISHTAYSRELFATGAVQAARFLAGKPAGMYGMEDLLTQL